MIRFRKPFRRVERGAYADAIVAFAREPWTHETNQDRPDRVSYRCILMLDLWLVIFTFRWETRLKDVE